MSAFSLLENLKSYIKNRISDKTIVKIGKIDFTNKELIQNDDMKKEDIFKINNYKLLCINDINTGKFYPPEFKIVCQVLNFPNYESESHDIKIIEEKTEKEIKTYLKNKIDPTQIKNNPNETDFKNQIETVIDDLKFLSTGVEKSNDQTFSSIENENITTVANTIDEKIQNKQYTVFDTDKVEVYSIGINVYDQIETFNLSTNVKENLIQILKNATHGNFKKRLTLETFYRQIDKIQIQKKTPKFVLPVLPIIKN